MTTPNDHGNTGNTEGNNDPPFTFPGNIPNHWHDNPDGWPLTDTMVGDGLRCQIPPCTNTIVSATGGLRCARCARAACNSCWSTALVNRRFPPFRLITVKVCRICMRDEGIDSSGEEDDNSRDEGADEDAQDRNEDNTHGHREHHGTESSGSDTAERNQENNVQDNTRWNTRNENLSTSSMGQTGLEDDQCLKCLKNATKYFTCSKDGCRRNGARIHLCTECSASNCPFCQGVIQPHEVQDVEILDGRETGDGEKHGQRYNWNHGLGLETKKVTGRVLETRSNQHMKKHNRKIKHTCMQTQVCRHIKDSSSSS